MYMDSVSGPAGRRLGTAMCVARLSSGSVCVVVFSWERWREEVAGGGGTLTWFTCASYLAEPRRAPLAVG